MIDITVKKVTVKNGGGSLACEMGELHWHDYVMLGDQRMLRPKRKASDSKIRKGSFWRPNLELNKRTKGDATHAHHDDAYRLLAAGEHVLLTEETEVEEMRRMISQAVDFSVIMLNYRAYTAEELTTVFDTQTARVITLSAVRDEDKIAAREKMAETLEADSLDRNNPPAKAMQNGAANARFRKRRLTALNVRNHEIVRTKQVSDMIVEHLHTYRQLWDALSMRVETEELRYDDQVFDVKAGLEDDFGSLLSEVRGSEGLKAAEARLKRFLDVFSSIRIRPFCKSAAHVVRELKIAARLCREGNRAGLKSVLRRLRRGIRWVFALDQLQTLVILPFSILLEKLYRLAKRERAQDGKFVKGPIVITRDMAPDLFGAIESYLESVREKIREKCRDDDLARKIKEDVEGYLGTAQEALRQNDWAVAKTELQRAARCM